MKQAADQGIVDLELVGRAAAGDHAAFAWIYERCAPRVYAVAMHLSADPTEAAEITQDTFVTVWRQLGAFRGDGSFEGWIHRTTVNTALQRFRSDRRRTDRVSADPAHTVANVPSPQVSLDDRIDLEAALRALSQSARTAFVLREIEGYPYSELAELLDSSEQAVRAQVYRARNAIMRFLED